MIRKPMLNSDEVYSKKASLSIGEKEAKCRSIFNIKFIVSKQILIYRKLKPNDSNTCFYSLSNNKK